MHKLGSSPEMIELPVPGDRPASILPGKPRLLVYLHGKCGDPRAFAPWARAASAWATVIALEGELPCRRDPSRRKWDGDIEALEIRILAAVRAAGHVGADDIAVAGYSQGAARAESLAARAPERFTRLLLIGGPDPPAAKHVARARAVALLAGERDRRRHLQRAAAALSSDGLPVRFWMLPGARHGEYGPSAESVLAEALEWVFSDGREETRR